MRAPFVTGFFPGVLLSNVLLVAAIPERLYGLHNWRERFLVGPQSRTGIGCTGLGPAHRESPLHSGRGSHCGGCGPTKTIAVHGSLAVGGRVCHFGGFPRDPTVGSLRVVARVTAGTVGHVFGRIVVVESLVGSYDPSTRYEAVASH